jgi:L-iditol 2-dehydrogenase
MRAVRLHGPGDLRLHEEHDPEPRDGEALVRVLAVGLCGSDRHWYLEGEIGDATLSRPLVLGHEFTGVIDSGARSGERVAVDPAIPCNRCELCARGQQHLCPGIRFAGHGSTDGALRTLMAWPEHLLHPIPDAVPDTEATLLEPLGVALHALDLGKVRAGTWAAVFGCGPIGLLLIQLLQLVGVAGVLARDPLPHRQAAAEALGAVADQPGVDVAFEVAGTDDAVAAAVDAAAPGGRVVLVGIPDEDRTSFPASVARRKGLTLLLSRRMEPADLPRAIRLAASGRIDLSGLVTERHPLAATTAAFQSLAARAGLKVVVEPQSSEEAM